MFTQKEVVELALPGLVSGAFWAVFWTGFGLIVWNKTGKKEGLINLFTGIIKRVFDEFGIGSDKTDGRIDRIAEEVDDTASKAGAWVADKLIRSSLPEDPSMRETYLRRLYGEVISHIPEATEHLDAIRVLWQPEDEYEARKPKK